MPGPPAPRPAPTELCASRQGSWAGSYALPDVPEHHPPHGPSTSATPRVNGSCRAMAATKLERLADEIHTCRRCPRLVEWREACAADPPKRYRGEDYWARPLDGFGDPAA